MKFRKLRIAFSVACGIACVLLVVLWIRSYWWHDAVYGPLPGNHRFDLSAACGKVRFATFDLAYESGFTGNRVTGWGHRHGRIKQPPRLELVNTPLRYFGLGFASSRDEYGIVSIVPIWFPVTLASLIAT